MPKRARFVKVAPVLPSRDIQRSLDYYVGKLGFTHSFIDASNDQDDPKYIGLERDAAELHVQWHSADEWQDMNSSPLIRLIVDDVDALFAEYELQGVFNPAHQTAQHGMVDSRVWLL